MIDKVIASIIALNNVNLFTALEIKVAYLAIKQDEKLDPVQVRRFVYAELLKLVKKGWLSKGTTKHKKISRYSKTEMFDQGYIRQFASCSENISKSVEDGYLQELSNKLKQLNKELLEGIGELELYIILLEQYPNRKGELKTKYITTKEQNHILNGKIRAINKLLGNPPES